jgi:hypothetical protein
MIQPRMAFLVVRLPSPFISFAVDIGSVLAGGSDDSKGRKMWSIVWRMCLANFCLDMDAG